MKSIKKLKISPCLFILVFMILSGCGLPVYEALDPPSLALLGTGVNAVAFNSISDDLVDGYVIYYKIYYSGDTLIRDEEKLFDPITYENDDLNELPTGDNLPKQLGFYRMGYLNNNNINIPQIPVNGGGQTVLIDFTNSSPQTSGTDPVIYVDSIDRNADFGIPARSVLYSDAGSFYPSYANNSTFKRFVKNYEYDGVYRDADIRQALSRGGLDIPVIEIAFVAYSYGISNTTLVPLSSVPVYLGTVIQTIMLDNNSNTAL